VLVWAALKVLYLTVLERRAKGANVTGRIKNWQSALNTLVMYYGDRLTSQ
jgi:putative transposase